jgi:hypothetical protein
MIDKVIDKCLSGRFIVLIMVAVTYCTVINACLWLTANGKMDVEFLKGLIAGLASNFVMFWKDYAVRTDRSTKDTNAQNPA